MGQHGQEFILVPVCFLQPSQQRGVLDGNDCPMRKIFGGAEVVDVIHATRVRADECHDTKDTHPGAERDADVGLEAEFPNEAEVLVVLGNGGQHFVRNRAGPLGLARADHLLRAVDVRSARRVFALQFAHVSDFSGIGMGHGDATQAPITLEEVDRAPIGEPGDGEGSDLLQRAVVVGEIRQGRARAGEKAGGLFGALDVGDVVGRADVAEEAPVTRESWHADRLHVAIDAIGAAKAELALEQRPPFHRLHVAADVVVVVVGVNEFRPIHSLDLALVHAEEIQVAPVDELGAVGVVQPDEDGRLVGKGTETFLALPQCVLSASPLDELADLAGKGGHRFQQLFVALPDVAAEELNHAQEIVVHCDGQRKGTVQSIGSRHGSSRKIRFRGDVRDPDRSSALPDPSREATPAFEGQFSRGSFEPRHGHRGRVIQADAAHELVLLDQPERGDLPLHEFADVPEDHRRRRLEIVGFSEHSRDFVLGTQPPFDPAPRGDIPCNLRDGDNPSTAVTDGRERQRHIEILAELRHSHRFVRLDPLPASQALQNHGFFMPSVRRDEHHDRPANRLGGLVAEQVLGTGVPGEDVAVERLADDRILRRFHDGGQARLHFVGPFEVRDVPREAPCMNEPSLVPQHARVDQDVPDRAVLASHPGFDVAEDLAVGESVENALDVILVDVELRDVVPDVLVTREAEHVQFGLVHAKDRAVGAHPMETDRGVLEKVGELAFALA